MGVVAVTSARTMPSLTMLAIVAFSSVFTPILGGSLQPFFGQFMKLAKEEQGLIKEQNLILEKILQAQEKMAQESQNGGGGGWGRNRIMPGGKDVEPGPSLNFEPEFETATLKSDHGDTESEYATATLRSAHGDYMEEDIPNIGEPSKERDQKYDNGIPREWVDKYRARKGDGNSLYMTIPRNHPDGNTHYFNGEELRAAAKGSGGQNRITNADRKRGRRNWMNGSGSQNRMVNGDKKGWTGNRMDEYQNGVDYRTGGGWGLWGRNSLQAGESYSDIPREWIDKYGARQGEGNSLYMTIPRNHPDGNAHYFNVQELKDAARGK